MAEQGKGKRGPGEVLTEQHRFTLQIRQGQDQEQQGYKPKAFQAQGADTGFGLGADQISGSRVGATAILDQLPAAMPTARAMANQ